jgi:hypothetical protein
MYFDDLLVDGKRASNTVMQVRHTTPYRNAKRKASVDLACTYLHAHPVLGLTPVDRVRMLSCRARMSW